VDASLPEQHREELSSESANNSSGFSAGSSDAGVGAGGSSIEESAAVDPKDSEQNQSPRSEEHNAEDSPSGE
jgi:hypothetical protein